MTKDVIFSNKLPAGAGQVKVDGLGILAFQPVGNTSYSTAIDIYFHPEGGSDRAPGFGRYRLRIDDHCSWGLHVDTKAGYRLDPELVKRALPIAEKWLRERETALFFQVHDSAAMALAAIKKKRDDLTWLVSARRNMMDRERAAAAGANELPRMTPERVAAAEKELADFEARMSVREPMLQGLKDDLRKWAHERRGARRRVIDILEDHAAKHAAIGISP